MKTASSDLNFRVVVVGQSGPREPGGIARVTQILSPLVDRKTVAFLNTMRQGRYSYAKFLMAATQLFGLVLRNKLLGVATIVHMNVSKGGSLFRKMFLGWMCSRMGVRFCIQLHSGHFFPFFDSLPIARKAQVKKFFLRSRLVLVFSEDYKQDLAARGLCDPEQTFIAVNGVPKHQVSTPPNTSMVKNKKFRLLFLGGISAPKGCRELIWLMEQKEISQSSHLFIAGPIIEKNLAEKLFANTSVTYLGNLAPVEVAGALRSADLVVLPSHAEGMPMVLLEAMAASKPFLSTRVGSVPKIISEDNAGVLVSVGNKEELLSETLNFIANPALGRRLGRNGFTAWQTRYSADSMLMNLLSAWQLALQ